MQPVAEDCLYTAMINAMLADEVFREIVNAVGSDTLTQKELFAYFAPNENPNFVHIPVDFARVLADNFPKGRIAPYAIEIFRELDIKPVKNQPICAGRFTQLLGKKPLGLRELYKEATLVTRRAPIGQHVREMMGSPREALTVAAAAIMSAKNFYFTSHDKK